MIPKFCFVQAVRNTVLPSTIFVLWSVPSLQEDLLTAACAPHFGSLKILILEYHATNTVPSLRESRGPCPPNGCLCPSVSVHSKFWSWNIALRIFYSGIVHTKNRQVPHNTFEKKMKTFFLVFNPISGKSGTHLWRRSFICLVII